MRADISRNRRSVKSEIISALIPHFYLPCLQQVAPTLTKIKSIAGFLLDILQLCDCASRAPILA